MTKYIHFLHANNTQMIMGYYQYWIGIEGLGRIHWDGMGLIWMDGWIGINRWIGLVGLDWIGIEHKIIPKKYAIHSNAIFKSSSVYFRLQVSSLNCQYTFNNRYIHRMALINNKLNLKFLFNILKPFFSLILALGIITKSMWTLRVFYFVAWHQKKSWMQAIEWLISNKF